MSYRGRNQIKAVYDNGGKTFDRYTVVFKDRQLYPDGINYYEGLGLSFNPDDPQGFSQHTVVHPDHLKTNGLGRKISFSDLPENVQKHVLKRI